LKNGKSKYEMCYSSAVPRLDYDRLGSDL
jgi:hypothetical protein